MSKSLVAGPRNVEKLTAIIMMGGPAAGKSTALNGLNQSVFVLMNPDEVKDDLPEFATAKDMRWRGGAAARRVFDGREDRHPEQAKRLDRWRQQRWRQDCEACRCPQGQAKGYTVDLRYVDNAPQWPLPARSERGSVRS